jgi:hypothetical protein
MAREYSLKSEGFDETMRELRGFESKVVGRVLAFANRKAVEPLKKAVIAEAPTRREPGTAGRRYKRVGQAAIRGPGFLRRSVKAGAKKRGKKRHSVTHRVWLGPAWYGRIVVRGRKKGNPMPRNPFVNRAERRAGPQAIETWRRVFAKRVQVELRKQKRLKGRAG